jgi:TonB family protein
MLKTFFGLTGGVVQLSIAIAINFSLFVLLPYTHNLFASLIESEQPAANKKRIVAEYIRPPKKEEKKEAKQRIRKVHSSTSIQPIKSAMDFKFTPDLGVEGSDGVAMVSRDLSAVVFEEGETDEDAVPLRIAQVPYPIRARELGVEGILEAILVIGVDGSVSSVEIRSSPHPSISAEAKKVIAGWKFKPAQNQGVPVSVRKKQVIEFKLNS